MKGSLSECQISISSNFQDLKISSMARLSMVEAFDNSHNADLLVCQHEAKLQAKERCSPLNRVIKIVAEAF